MKSVFEFSDYKSILKGFEADKLAFPKGFRSRLAETLRCQNAYVSNVLNTNANFSPEQGFKISRFLGLKGEEQKYFLLLLDHERAGDTELKQHIHQQLLELRNTHLEIKKHVADSIVLDHETQAQYYSDWLYAAIHLLPTIPGCNTVSKIAAELSVSEEVTRKAVQFLVSCGLLNEEKGILSNGRSRIHLDRESPFIKQHHTNWRINAIQSLSSPQSGDIHYSTVSTLSLKDAEQIRLKIVQFIKDYVAEIGPSKEETMVSFNLDFFSLLKKD